MNRDAIFKLTYIARVPARRGRSKWGGSRPGAGRKTSLEDRVRLTVHLEQEDLDELRAEAAEKDVSVGHLVRKIVGTYLRRRRG